MKKLFALIFTVIVVLFSFTAIAEGVNVGEPFDWTYLATIAGATALTLLIAEFAKFPLDKVWHIPTRVLVYCIALVIMVVATYFTVGITLENVLLDVVNAFIVALSAYGSYQLTFEKIEH